MMPRLLRSFIADVRRSLGPRFELYLVLMTLTGLVEAVGIAGMVPLLGSAGVGGGGEGTIARLLPSLLAHVGVTPTTAAIGVLILSCLLASTALTLAQAYVGANLQTAYVFRWQQRVASAAFNARWRHLQQRPQGEVVHALVTETQRLGGAFYQVSLLLTGVVHALLYVAVAAALSGPTTWAIVGGGALLFLVTRPLIGRAHAIGSGIARDGAALQSLAGDLASGAKLVKATASERDAVALVTRTADRLRQHFLWNAFDVQVAKAVFDLGAAVLGAGILAVTLATRTGDPAVTLVVLAVFVRLMPKVTGVQFSLQSLGSSLPAMTALRAVVERAEAEAETLSSEPLPTALRDGPLAVELSQVHVQHGTVAALAAIDLAIPAGSCVALAGSSGGGKSTLVDAVLGLVPVERGTIAISGTTLAELPIASLRRRVGYMGQDSVVFHATVADNLRWGHGDLSDAELVAAARLAGAHEFIAALPDGYATIVGGGGRILSGGERQRLALARAMAGRPGLLILDEATSALDAESERAVTEAIVGLRDRVTVLMIAHRLSSLRVADTICVLENGRIVERGSWDQLLRRAGRFAELWRLQHGPTAIAADAG